MSNNINAAALILRLGLGTMFVAHGLLKVLVFTLPGTAAFFEQAGFPGWMAFPVSVAEIAGGILLLAGIGVRATVLGLLPILLGAVFVHAGHGWVFSNPNGGWEYPAFLALVSIVLLLIGPGRFTLRLPRPTSSAGTTADRVPT
jgi:putative oxidoreductase